MNEPTKTADASGAATLRQELAANNRLLGPRPLKIPAILAELTGGKKTFYLDCRE